MTGLGGVYPQHLAAGVLFGNNRSLARIDARGGRARAQIKLVAGGAGFVIIAGARVAIGLFGWGVGVGMAVGVGLGILAKGRHGRAQAQGC